MSSNNEKRKDGLILLLGMLFLDAIIVFPVILKHILHKKQSYRSEIMLRIESSGSASITSTDEQVIESTLDIALRSYIAPGWW